jgi:salicylate hydroxylase
LSTPTYRNGRIVVLGDAAHASTPHQGSGAGQCLEDALILSHLLGMATDVQCLDAAFQVYDALCRPRGQEIVRTSNEAGHLYTLTHQVCGEDIKKVVENANRRFQWIWTHDLGAELKKAENAFTELQSTKGAQNRIE